MDDQSQCWSRVADRYEQEFVDPYRPTVRSPLFAHLRGVSDSDRKVAADLGCGIGPLLPILASQFSKVYALDFAEGMLRRARERCGTITNIAYRQSSLLDLSSLREEVDVAVAINSLVLPDSRQLDLALGQIQATLRPGGDFFGIVPAMDGVHYYTMLLLDRALATGKPMEAARKNAAHLNDHDCYDFAFSTFRFAGIEQHFWQPFEVRYRLKRAGFRLLKLTRVRLDWKQFANARELKQHPPPWDWFFHARKREAL